MIETTDLTGKLNLWETDHEVLVGFDYLRRYVNYRFGGYFQTGIPALAIDIFDPTYGIDPALFREELVPGPGFERVEEEWYGVYFQDHITLISDLKQRIQSIAQSTILTTKQFQHTVEQAVQCFSEWMVRENIVRIIGAGRARLAASIPANRLAHGGARVYIQDSVVPMPHDIKGGGVIAVSASGRTTTVLNELRELKRKRTSTSHAQLPFSVVGIARHDATEFSHLCDIFIGVRLDRKPNPLQALADTEEYVISMILDALVVAAGKRAGFDDIKWRLGHENWGGATGPYDTIGNPFPPLHAPPEFVDD